MTEYYQVTLYSQMGPRQGTLTLEPRGDQITGSLDLVGYRNAVRGTRAADGSVHLFHPIRTVVSTFSCETRLEFSQDRLTGESDARLCRIRWEGARVRRGGGESLTKEPKP